ncbi:MAG TPA: prenyltransferase [Polyangiaceae bacterium]|nr:prenyltransferase [Polyangiaceae bacterium]
MHLRAFIRLGRPQYLFKSALLYSLGATVALIGHHRISIGWYAFGQLFVSCVHLMTHYCNEYFDLEADRANHGRAGVTGGSRVLADGILAPDVSLGAGFILLFVGVALLIGMPSGAARWMCCAILVLGWFYTAPPFKFNHRSMGELCSMVVIDVLCPVLAFYLQAGTVDSLLLMVLLPNCIVQYSYMMMMNLFDYEGDRAAGKRTLVVALGPATAARMYVFSHLLAYASVIALWWAGLPGSVVLTIGLTVPHSLWLCRQVSSGAHRGLLTKSRVAFSAAAYTMVVAVATNIGLLLSPRIDWSRFNSADGRALCVTVTFVCTAWLMATAWTKTRVSRQTE